MHWVTCQRPYCRRPSGWRFCTRDRRSAAPPLPSARGLAVMALLYSRALAALPPPLLGGTGKDRGPEADDLVDHDAVVVHHFNLARAVLLGAVESVPRGLIQLQLLVHFL